MKLGTPGFVGERLREAREALGITQASLAELCSVSRQAISQYEKGGTTPIPSVAERLAAILQVESEYFFTLAAPGESLGLMGPLFFRSRKAELKTARQRSRVRQEWFTAIVDALQQVIDFPYPDIPNNNYPNRPEMITHEMVENAAESVRKAWNLGQAPIGNLTWLMENHGIFIAIDETQDMRLEAFSSWRGSIPFVMLGEDARSWSGSRLSLAHELGHLVLHRSLDDIRIQRREDLALIEDQAYHFARSFLFPNEQFLERVQSPSLERFLTLKRTWGISVQAQLVYARDVGLISRDESDRLWRSVSRRGWRRSEPGDDRIREEPVMLRNAMDLVVAEPSLSIHTVFQQCPLGSRVISNLTGIPERLLAPKAPQPQLKVEGNILAFPSSQASQGTRGN